jgi:hypothetical protein
LSDAVDPGAAEKLRADKPRIEPIRVRTVGEYLATKPDIPPELVSPRMLFPGGICAMVGAGGVGKSTNALTRIFRWGAGLPWFDEIRTAFVPDRPIRTLIVENEGAAPLFWEKIDNMLRNAPVPADRLDGVRENVLIAGDGGYSNIRLDDPDSLASVEAALRDLPDLDVVFMEPFSRLWRGDENSNTEMNAMLSVLEHLAGKYGVAIMLSHHRKKGAATRGESQQEFARGASALEGAVSYFEFLNRAPHSWAEVECTKNRYADTPGPFYYAWKGHGSGWYDPVDAVGKLVEFMESKNQSWSIGQLVGKGGGGGWGMSEARIQAIIDYGMRQDRIQTDDIHTNEKTVKYMPKHHNDEDRAAKGWDF